MSVPKYIYLGNILGATGPIGPSGSMGIGCPHCSTLVTGEWSQSGSYLELFSNRVSFEPSCWITGEGVTINGKDGNNLFISEHLSVNSINHSTKKITLNNLARNYNSNHSVTICHGNNIGPTGPSNGPTGSTGPIGPSGLRGADCKGCFGVSTTNLDLSSPLTAPGEKVIITIEEGLSCINGSRVRVHDKTINSTSFLEGTVNLYENNKLTIAVDYRKGNSNSSSWSFGVAGIVGATGPIGLDGPEMSLIAQDRQIIFNDLGDAKGAEIFYKVVNNSDGQLVNRLGILTSTPQETVDISGSLKIRKVDPVSWPYN